VQLSFSLDALNQVDAAKEMLHEAIRTFKELGAKRDLEKSRSRLKTLGSAGDGNLGLTKREIDILKQISAGKNNEQISDTLSLSVRTVEKHLSNIYQKLGISGKSARAYAASFASKNLH
jgi:DNA-binding NarL/FixJ family response regulator